MPSKVDQVADDAFVHLHLHTQYSLLDGANQIDRLLNKAQAFGMSAMAITDHGNLFGAIEFYKKATARGLKPILGCEMYVAPRSRFERDARGGSPGNTDDGYDETGGRTEQTYHHLILLAADLQGYRNLIKLVSAGYLEGFYHKPRIDEALLRDHHEGLIALSGCLRGKVPSLLRSSHRAEAVTVAREYAEIFGPERFYLEIQANGLEIQTQVNRDLISLARETGLPLVATNDCHYLERADVKAHDVLLCLQTGKTLSAPGRFRFKTDELYVKSAREMAEAFPDIPEAIQNTRRIADLCTLRLDFAQVHLPPYRVPSGETKESYMETLAHRGLEERLASDPGLAENARADYGQRLKHELRVINSMGYAGYFLIIWDLVKFAKGQGIPVGPGRGSAAGSLVAYGLGITDVDPIRYGLLFERFLNPERVSLPDIDMDFCKARRPEVIEYITKTYGHDHVAQIITFGTMKARAVVRDVGRVLEFPYAEVDRLAKLIPTRLNITLDEALKEEPRLMEAARANPKVQELLDYARSLEGLARHASTHAAGIVIAGEPLVEHVPLYKNDEGELLIQYDDQAIKDVGLVKFDILGLRNLTMIAHTIRLIRERHGVALDPARLPLDDVPTYALLASGRTMGLFQLESRGMRDLLVRLKPDRLEDVIAAIALYRPGPIQSGMLDNFVKGRRGQAQIADEVLELREILDVTYGVIVYQEQVMRIANVLGGFTLGEADILRKAMGDKDKTKMAQQRARFIAGVTVRGISQAKATKVFELMAHFAEYGFNRSHSAAYAMISYQTAYLKTHYPREFMAALLTSEMGTTDQIVRYMTECREIGIAVLPPDVNESDSDFTVVEHGIRFGLAAVKNVGETAIESVLQVRRATGPFTSLMDFCRRVDHRRVNRRVIEGLIKCGAFDSTGARRSQLMEVLDRAIEEGHRAQRAAADSQTMLFASAPGRHADADFALPDLPEWDEAQRLQYEKEATGFYVTGHPLMLHRDVISAAGATTIEAVGDLADGSEARLCGLAVRLRKTTTKRGDPMAYLGLEDLTGTIEVIVFPDLYQTAAPFLSDGAIPLVVTGVVDHGENASGTTLRLKGTRIEPLAVLARRVASLASSPDPAFASQERGPVPLTPSIPLVTPAPRRCEIVLDPGRVTTQDLHDLKALIEQHPGPCALSLIFHVPGPGPGPHDPDHDTVIATGETLRVEPRAAFVDAVRSRYGGMVRLA